MILFEMTLNQQIIKDGLNVHYKYKMKSSKYLAYIGYFFILLNFILLLNPNRTESDFFLFMLGGVFITLPYLSRYLTQISQ